MSLHDPEATLKVLEDQAIEDDLGEIVAMSDEALAEALHAEGIDLAATRADALEVAARAAGQGGARGLQRSPRTSRAVWLAAAAAVVLLLGTFGVAEGPAIVTWLRGAPEPIQPDNERPRPLSPRELAEKARDEAEQACASELWGLCRDKLNEAGNLDPAGDSEERVQRMRQTIRDRTTIKPAPKQYPK